MNFCHFFKDLNQECARYTARHFPLLIIVTASCNLLIIFSPLASTSHAHSAILPRYLLLLRSASHLRPILLLTKILISDSLVLFSWRSWLPYLSYLSYLTYFPLSTYSISLVFLFLELSWFIYVALNTEETSVEGQQYILVPFRTAQYGASISYDLVRQVCRDSLLLVSVRSVLGAVYLLKTWDSIV